MKQRHMLSLLQTGYTTIHVAFPMSKHTQDVPASRRKMPWEHDPSVAHASAAQVQQDKTYVYKCNDPAVKVGDRVIVERVNTPSGLAIGLVIAVDPSPKIDVDAEFDYKWIVQRVDMQAYVTAMRAEEQFEANMQEVEREHQRQQLLDKMSSHLQPGSEARKLFDAAVQNFSTAFGAQAPIALQPVPAPTQQPQTAHAGAAVEQPIAGMQCK